MLILYTYLGRWSSVSSQTRGVTLSLPVYPSAMQPFGLPLWESPALSLSSSLTLLFFPGCGRAPADPGSGEEDSGRGAQPGE